MPLYLRHAQETSILIDRSPEGLIMRRWILALFLVGGSLSGGPQKEVTSVPAAVSRYCVGCHNNKLKTAGLAELPIWCAFDLPTNARAERRA